GAVALLDHHEGVERVFRGLLVQVPVVAELQHCLVLRLEGLVLGRDVGIDLDRGGEGCGQHLLAERAQLSDRYDQLLELVRVLDVIFR
ncbi:hypothetical protein DKP78_20770, partial [Enterococcus faecium]